MSSVAQAKKSTPGLKENCEFESIALLLQGGGALGAYQAGVYEALAEADIAPNWVGGISIGAINGAIISGNRPENRVPKLRDFWEHLTSNPLWNDFGALAPFIRQGGDVVRSYWNQMSAATSLVTGVPGFFSPHLVPPWLSFPGSPSSTSYYDTAGFRRTLERFIDFDILNTNGIRYTTSAVNVRSGNYTVFDTTAGKIGPQHIMASGALPPALPAVEIDGQYYWDGGLISNTPLQWVMDDATDDTLVFQVDLWSARGEMPKEVMGVLTRQKEIQYSSRTRAVTDKFRREQQLRHAFATLYEKMPESLKETDEAQMLYGASDFNVYNIVHLIYRSRHDGGYTKDYEFSRLSMEEHWSAGYHDTVRSLQHKEVLARPACAEGIMIYDVAGD
jgi:NTE family protein